MLPHSNGASTADTVAGREEIRAIFADVADLPGDTADRPGPA